MLCVQESERKAYNPRSFCKVYTMNHQPLNTGEQKDMTEFFQDLISKLEDMGIELVSHRLRFNSMCCGFHCTIVHTYITDLDFTQISLKGEVNE